MFLDKQGPCSVQTDIVNQYASTKQDMANNNLYYLCMHLPYKNIQNA